MVNKIIDELKRNLIILFKINLRKTLYKFKRKICIKNC